MSTADPQLPSPLQENNADQQGPRLPIKTHHCRFCSHLLLSTTRPLSSLPTRKEPSLDNALILPLPSDTEDETEASPGQKQKHYTILLSTVIPDRKPTLVRREDGFEKRLLLRCGRCRVVMGYFLDPVHFPRDGEDGVDLALNDKATVVYLLPGGLLETEVLGDEERMATMDREWNGWL